MKSFLLPRSLRARRLRVAGAGGDLPPDGASPAPATTPAPSPAGQASSSAQASGARGLLGLVYALVSTGASALLAYHGYGRNNGSVWSAIKWSVLGTLPPVMPIALGVAVKQGLGKPRELPTPTPAGLGGPSAPRAADLARASS